MELDLTYYIKKIIKPQGWLAGLDGKKYDIRPCDDIDEYYIIRTSDGSAFWLNSFLGTNIRIEELSSPEKGVIEVKVKKTCPHIHDDYEDPEQFQKEVAKYFSTLGWGVSFKLTPHYVNDTVDTSHMEYNDEGDEIGWVESEATACVAMYYVLELEGAANFTEEMKNFIIRKLENILAKKGVKCYEEEVVSTSFELYHYKFATPYFY